ncbi:MULTISPECIES: TIGR02530 family flagellar biosynthesis protein [Carboxydocella]|uniref:Flagellar operon protein n=2 Tax=Carboxydocella TaxID=178898 RepID=A0A1T4PAH4_9FIRM|nr:MULTISPECIES: TIGR02530 family flagellar biosynthesis protein [Carboxydocella]AVX20767.1 flagellar operon protein [Carboxydocella thermautotrophica]AVX31186.1 flagellar operon protein [Carboxydocella thermautotrophica]SJZ88502.1 flagellar operon protein [Carboxydocella sporoproducens DSM 16521]GAW28296.1 flagellar protein [Carboxydocella sp. ULO1]GAW32133.1 flagellar protein [Carboxydocella sp. JDF658]
MSEMLRGITGQSIKPAVNQPGHGISKNVNFAGILQQAVNKQKLKFSGHALERLGLRNSTISERAQQKLEDAVAKAAAKGAKEALIWLDNTAYVVSIKNRTVITAVTKEAMKENVFTNIDCAVIMD